MWTLNNSHPFDTNPYPKNNKKGKYYHRSSIIDPRRSYHQEAALDIWRMSSYSRHSQDQMSVVLQSTGALQTLQLLPRLFRLPTCSIIRFSFFAPSRPGGFYARHQLLEAY